MPELDHISQSQISAYATCGEKYRRRYIENEKREWGGNLIVGVSTHKPVEGYYRKKIKNELMTFEEMMSISEEESKKLIDKYGLQILQGETSEMILADIATRSFDHLQTFVKEVGPNIDPKLVEFEFSIESEEKWAFNGKIDLVDIDNIIRDLKTSSTKSNDVDDSLQLTLYWYGYMMATGEMPEGVAIDQLVRTKSGKCSYNEYLGTRTSVQIEKAIQVVQAYVDAIRAGIFVPRPRTSSRDWHCSEKFCEFYKDCKYVTG